MRQLLFILSFLSVAMVAAAQHSQRVMDSQLLVDTVYSKVLGAERAYSIVLPRGYEAHSEKRYPILYLLHGMWDTNVSWSTKGCVKEVMDMLVASGEACDMIIVTPNAGGNIHTEWNGYFDMPGWNYEEFFYTEFLPYIEAKYRVMGHKQHRAIAGLSMGGGGATSYAQRYPQMYCAAYAMSALMHIPQEGAVRYEDQQSKIALLTRAVINLSCVEYVEQADEARTQALREVAWFVDCGDDDFLLDRNLEFYQAMRNKGIPCQLRVRDGGHVWEYWRTALYSCLPFVSRHFRSAATE
ncbi:MAG: alpha/beta hydrolase [Phocaeicola sp.]